MPHTPDISPLRPDDHEVCHQVAALVNRVYLATEGPMWRAGAERTTVDEVRDLAAAGKLHGVLDGAGALAVVRVDVADGRGELGMLAVRPEAGGRGLGTTLVRYAEQLARGAGAGVMELVVARPRDTVLPAKARLGGWYPRLGYELTATRDVAQVYPELLEVFVVPVVIDVYERAL